MGAVHPENKPESSNRDERKKYTDTVKIACDGKEMEEELRRRLAFHFMDPVEKFIARRQVPWKLLLQFLKGRYNIKIRKENPLNYKLSFKLGKMLL